MRSWQRTLAVGCAAVAALLLGACQQNEQGRPLSFEPGVYKRDKLPALTDEQTKTLRDRGGLQR
jgi:hypothetical protein